MGLWPAGGWARRLLRFGRRTLGRAPGQPFWVYGRRYALDLVWPVADLRRGERILSFLEQAGLLGRADVLWARPASIHKLLLVHGHEYLESLEEHAQLERILGFPVPPGHQDELLLSQRAMVGGTLLATRYALDHGAIAVNLGGGLHHAMAGRGQGMCVFNDVAITIAHQRSRGFDGRVLVIDLDLHDGDGTRDIFRRDRSVHTFSIHNDDLGDVDALESTSIALGPNVTDATYLEALRRSLPRVLESFRPSRVV
jgi:acetoin utilization deacetylase AcuC-like enzyme